jgi:hypothetical protein
MPRKTISILSNVLLFLLFGAAVYEFFESNRVMVTYFALALFFVIALQRLLLDDASKAIEQNTRHTLLAIAIAGQVVSAIAAALPMSNGMRVILQVISLATVAIVIGVTAWKRRKGSINQGK